jgi:predicted alpha/beta-hydrolase family hydrolase
VSASLASQAACPIVVVPAGASQTVNPWPAGPVVCGVDGHVESTRARVVAEGLADRLGLLTIPVHAQGDEPAAALTQLASRLRAALIVVGHRDATGLLASVSSSLAAEAPVPVLIVPPAARLPHLTADAELAVAA